MMKKLYQLILTIILFNNNLKDVTLVRNGKAPEPIDHVVVVEVAVGAVGVPGVVGVVARTRPPVGAGA